MYIIYVYSHVYLLLKFLNINKLQKNVVINLHAHKNNAQIYTT